MSYAKYLEDDKSIFSGRMFDQKNKTEKYFYKSRDKDNKKRTRIFYCDPQASWQKPKIEKNHEFIRYVLPKGKSLNPYTQEDMTILANHINSTRRKMLDGKSPYEVTTNKSVLNLMEVMGLHIIPPDEVNLTPDLLKVTR